METLGKIYGNGYRACHPKGKTYRDAQLDELVHSIVVKHAPEQGIVCGREPAGEKCREGETATEQ
jgi:hypothetical protein